jgi:hypothetical protein
MLFLSRSEKNNNEGDEIIDDNKINFYPSLDDLGVFVKNIFSYYIYYIACVLFY